MDRKDFILAECWFRLHKKNAFTLAEVLITLGIIGVVAALVLPGMIEGYEKRVISVGFMKTYSNLSKLVAEFEREYDYLPQNGNKARFLVNHLQHNLKLSRCTSVDSKTGQYRNDKILRYSEAKKKNGEFGKISGNTFTPTAHMCSPDGTIYILTAAVDGMTSYVTGANYAYNRIMVDVNGLRGPNVLFKDIFIFVYLPFEPQLGSRAQTPYYHTYSGSPQNSAAPVRVIAKNAHPAVLYPSGYGVENEPKMGCKERRDGSCAIKIITNGSIPKDYPWKKGQHHLILD